jgi:hypothetical protein
MRQVQLAAKLLLSQSILVVIQAGSLIQGCRFLQSKETTVDKRADIS